jgi:aerobic-type carbon monoxide dehydrogenase small subunit (CoxS/CutS family)
VTARQDGDVAVPAGGDDPNGDSRIDWPAGVADDFCVTVNGVERSVTCRPQTPLLYALRNDWDLKGTRLGCGLGQCGACMVLVDGEPTASCSLPIQAVNGRSVTTVEGLSAEGRLGRLQESFLEEQASQCGYCMSGILISATALLARNPRPDRAEICQALDGNLCRCGSHNRVIRAVLRAVGSA